MKLRSFKGASPLAIIQAVHDDNPGGALTQDSADSWVVEHPFRLIIDRVSIRAAIAGRYPSLQDDDWKVIRTAFDRAPREIPSGRELI